MPRWEILSVKKEPAGASQPAYEDWVLGEADALLDTVHGRIARRIRDRRTA